LAEGARADLVVWDCHRVEDVVATMPDRRFVLKHGRVTIAHERRVRVRCESSGDRDASSSGPTVS
jgi:N-acyl-D-aspartate/D-glutamate deacylase